MRFARITVFERTHFDDPSLTRERELISSPTNFLLIPNSICKEVNAYFKYVEVHLKEFDEVNSSLYPWMLKGSLQDARLELNQALTEGEGK